MRYFRMMSWRERFSEWWRNAVCKVAGHAKPEQRMFCRICSRCREVVPPERRMP